MEEFSGETLHIALVILERLRDNWANAQPLGDAFAAKMLKQERVLTEAERSQLSQSLEAMVIKLEESCLSTSGESTRDLSVTVNQTVARELPATLIAHDLAEIQKTIQREMRTSVFLHVGGEDVRRYREPLREWDSVIKRWPETKNDISESSLCFALGRFGGSVFHLSLVAEFGAIQLGHLLSVAGDRPGWNCVARLEEILGRKYPVRTALEQQHSDLLHDMVPKAVSLRNARHQLTHADNSDTWIAKDIGPRTANEAMSATRAFMRELADRMPK